MVVHLPLRRDSAWTTLPPLLRSASVAAIGVTLKKFPLWNIASWMFPDRLGYMWLKGEISAMTENSVVRPRIDAGANNGIFGHGANLPFEPHVAQTVGKHPACDVPQRELFESYPDCGNASRS